MRKQAGTQPMDRYLGYTSQIRSMTDWMIAATRSCRPDKESAKTSPIRFFNKGYSNVPSEEHMGTKSYKFEALTLI